MLNVSYFLWCISNTLHMAWSVNAHSLYLFYIVNLYFRFYFLNIKEDDKKTKLLVINRVK